MKKACVILPALLLTAAMVWMFPRLLRPQLPEIQGKKVLRIWVTEEEPAVGSWLKKRAAAYEKMTGQRTCLRMGKMRETDAGLIPPGCMWGLPDLLPLRKATAAGRPAPKKKKTPAVSVSPGVHLASAAANMIQ